MSPQNDINPISTDSAEAQPSTAEAISDSVPTLPPGADQILRLIGEIEALRRSVESLAANNVFVTNVAKRIVESEALAPLIARTVQEALHIAQHEIQPAFIGLACELFEAVEDESQFGARVLRHADNHPLTPGGLEFFLLDQDSWVNVSVNELAARAIIDAMEKMDAKRGTTYWCRLHNVWDRPLQGQPNTRITEVAASAETPLGDSPINDDTFDQAPL